MTLKEIVDAILKLAEILTSAPVILLLLVILFQRQIRQLFPALSERIKSINIKEGEIIFSEVQKAAVSALPEVIDKGLEEYKDQPEQLAGFVREQVKKLPEFQATTTTGVVPRLSGRSILWVDDNPMNNVYESSVLKKTWSKYCLCPFNK